MFLVIDFQIGLIVGKNIYIIYDIISMDFDQRKIDDKSMNALFQSVFKDRGFKDIEGRDDGSVTHKTILFEGGVEKKVSVTSATGTKGKKARQLERIRREIDVLKKNYSENIINLVKYSSEVMVTERLTYDAKHIPSYREMTKIAAGCIKGIKYLHTNNPDSCLRHGHINFKNIVFDRDERNEITRVALGSPYVAVGCDSPLSSGIGLGSRASGSKFDDVESLATTLIFSYLREHFDESESRKLTITHRGAERLIGFLNQEIVNVLSKMIRVKDQDDLAWSAFLDELIQDWDLLSQRNIPDEVITIPQDTIDENVHIIKRRVQKGKKVLPVGNTGTRKFLKTEDGLGKIARGVNLPSQRVMEDFKPSLGGGLNNDFDFNFDGIIDPNDNLDIIPNQDLSEFVGNLVTCNSDSGTFRYFENGKDTKCEPVVSVRGGFNEQSKCCEIKDDGVNFKFLRALEFLTREMDLNGLREVADAVNWIRVHNKTFDSDTLVINPSEDDAWYTQLLEFSFGIGIPVLQQNKVIKLYEATDQNIFRQRIDGGIFHAYQGEDIMISRMRSIGVNGSIRLHANQFSDFESLLGGSLDIIPCKRITITSSLPIESDYFDISKVAEVINSVTDNGGPVRVFNNSIGLNVNVQCVFDTSTSVFDRDVAEENLFKRIFISMASHSAETNMLLTLKLFKPRSVDLPIGMEPLRVPDSDTIESYARTALGNGIAFSTNSHEKIIRDSLRGVRYTFSHLENLDIIIIRRGKIE